MIKLQEMTPDVYYNQSRDFQFIGRLFDVVLNATKTNTAAINNIQYSENNKSTIDLWAMSLGFTAKHEYNNAQLIAICSILPIVLKNKGSLYAIELAANTLLHSEGITESCEVFFETTTTASGEIITDYTKLTVSISDKLSDINLFKDLLDYILPAGVSCKIIRSVLFTKVVDPTMLATFDTVKYKEYEVVDNATESIIPHLDELPNNITGPVDKLSIDTNYRGAIYTTPTITNIDDYKARTSESEED